MKSLFSPGKLLLTSEYFVLDGALALAVPTKLGQEFFFEEYADDKTTVVWEAYHEGKIWLKAKINYSTWQIIDSNLQEPAEFVVKVLNSVKNLSETKFKGLESYFIKTNLQFPSNFGLGSSSTLMNNLAEWSGIDAFQLNDLALGGSGYDIAVAQAKEPLLFQIQNGERIFSEVDFNPVFKEELIFVHLNQKQDSREGIQMYRSNPKSQELIDFFSNLTKEVKTAKTLENFSELMAIHENEVSQFLNIATAKENYFHDIPVFVKSLGAWGGDFIMSRKFDDYKDYFSNKNFHTIFSYTDLIG